MGEKIGIKSYQFEIPVNGKHEIPCSLGLINVVESNGVIHGLLRKQYSSYLDKIGESVYIGIGEEATEALRIYNSPDYANYRITFENNYKLTLNIHVLIFA